MQDEKVLEHLITLYQMKGLSLDRVLRDPVFQQLPLDKKIKAVKDYGSSIESGISFDKDDVKKLLKVVGMGVTAAAAGFLAYSNAKRFAGSGSPLPLIGAITATSLPIGQVAGALGEYHQHQQKKEAVKDYLRYLSQNDYPEPATVRLLSLGAR